MIEQEGKRLREEINRNNLLLKRPNLGELILYTVTSESMNACGKLWKLKVQPEWDWSVMLYEREPESLASLSTTAQKRTFPHPSAPL